MPWTTDKPPAVAKNWSADEQAKCVAAGNAVMAEKNDDRQAIFACIHAAGRSEKGMGDRMNILEKIIDWLKGGEELQEGGLVPQSDGIDRWTSDAVVVPKEKAVMDKGLRRRDLEGRIQDLLPKAPLPIAETQAAVEESWWVEDVVPDGNTGRAIIRHGAELFGTSYTVDAEGNITLGDLAPGEMVFQVKPASEKAMGLKVAEVDGKTMWFAYTTNAFEDREQEIFSTKALEDYVASVDSGEIPDGVLAELKARDLPLNSQGELWLMHLPHTRIGEPLWKAVEGRFLLEAGVFDNTPMAQKVAAHLKEHGSDYGLSHGYLYNPGDREDGVYDWMHKFETSLLPVGWAANAWTAFSVIDSKEVSMVDAKKRSELITLAGGDEALVDGFLKTASERTAKLEGEGAKFKGEPPPAPPPPAEPVAEVAPVVEPPKVEEEPKPEAEVEDKAAAAILQLAAEVKAMDTKISSAFETLRSRIVKLEADGQTYATLSSRKSWLRPSQAGDNVITDEAAKVLAPAGTAIHPIDAKMAKRG